MIERLSRVALKSYPKIEGRVRRVDYLKISEDGTYGNVANVYWDDGSFSYCPVERLQEAKPFLEEKYPWEKSPEQEKKDENVNNTSKDVRKKARRR